MKARRRSRARTIGFGMLAVILTGCAGAGGSTGVSPSASVTTAIQGWERYFTLDWAVQPQPTGALIDGYVHNTYGTPAANVQVLAQALDQQGNVLAQKLEWVPGMVPPLQRAFFRVPGLPAAPQYRVAVWAFDWVEAPSIER